MKTWLKKNFFVYKEVKKIDSDIKRFGLQKSMLRLINRCGTELSIKTENELVNEILKKQGVLVVANHPAECDVVAMLAAVQTREDTNLIINENFKNVCKRWQKYLIPVYISHRLRKKNKFSFRYGLARKILSCKDYTHEEEHKRNVASIKLASKKINKNELVILFPGGGGKDGKWFNGIGYLIDGVKNKNNKYVLKAFIEGTSTWDYLRFIPGVAKFLPKFRVTFSDPKELICFENAEPKIIAANLENEYNDWVNTLETNNSLVKRVPDVFSGALSKSVIIMRSLLFWFTTKIN